MVQSPKSKVQSRKGTNFGLWTLDFGLAKNMTSSLRDRVIHTVDFVGLQLPAGWRPEVAIILGSGLGALADEVHVITWLPYSNVPGFGQSSVPGHAGRLVFGELEGKRVVAMQGRYHFYEGYDLQHVT